MFSCTDETDPWLLIELLLLALLASFVAEFLNSFLWAVERRLSISTPYKPVGFKFDSCDTLIPLFLPKNSSLGLCILLFYSLGENTECSETEIILFLGDKGYS